MIHFIITIQQITDLELIRLNTIIKIACIKLSKNKIDSVEIEESKNKINKK